MARMAAGAGASDRVCRRRPRRVAFRRRPDELLLVPLHHIYGSDDRSMYTPGVAGRAPAPYIALGRADADRLGLADGDWLQLWQPWMDVRAPFRLLPSLPEGVAGVPAGLPGMPFISLPAAAAVLRRTPASAGRPGGADATCASTSAAWAPAGATRKPDDAPDVEAAP